MAPPIRGLHHVTATVAGAQDDLDFYVRLLGLRLVKKTVNFDNRGVYHFYYGNESGAPSTLMTTFPYGDLGVPMGRKGSGQVTETAFSVPSDALDAWESRLREADLSCRRSQRFANETLSFEDPSGLRIELIGADDGRAPWVEGSVDAPYAIRGIHSVTLRLRETAATLAMLTEALGFRVHDDSGGRTRVAVQDGRPGELLDLLHDPDAREAVNGLGTVHHVALAVDDDEAQSWYRERLLEAGRHVTEVKDRQYFRSIYFRGPGGVLFEIATIPPGFEVDEPLDGLGRSLKLPPWEEHHRASIEAELADVEIP